MLLLYTTKLQVSCRLKASFPGYSPRVVTSCRYNNPTAHRHHRVTLSSSDRSSQPSADRQLPFPGALHTRSVRPSLTRGRRWRSQIPDPGSASSAGWSPSTHSSRSAGSPHAQRPHIPVLPARQTTDDVTAAFPARPCPSGGAWGVERDAAAAADASGRLVLTGTNAHAQTRRAAGLTGDLSYHLSSDLDWSSDSRSPTIVSRHVVTWSANDGCWAAEMREMFEHSRVI